MLAKTVAGVTARVRTERDAALASDVHGERTAAILGIALGVCFTVCFATGLLSHLAQHPTSWFTLPPRPAGLYRVTQGLHIATGLASVPLLLAKLWSVFPNLLQWPPVQSVAHAVERLMLVPLVCGAVFMLFSGTANIAQWYPWRFNFPIAHYWVAWITIGALVTHIGAKLITTRDALRRDHADGALAAVAAEPVGLNRRQYLRLTAAAAAFVTVTTIGQTVRPLRKLALFAPRRPDVGPQGLPVNATATSEIRAAASDPGYRLRVVGDVARPLELTYADLQALAQHEAELPIACVEGWSASAHWSGVALRTLLAAAGVADDERVAVTVRSLQTGGAYNRSDLDNRQARDPDTLIALRLNGETLHPNHGYPCRLIGPNRPGVLQTKWLREIEVRSV